MQVRTGEGGSGDGPTEAMVKTWAIQIGKIELFVVQGMDSENDGYRAMRTLILDDADLPSVSWRSAGIALGLLAEAMGRGKHPFMH